MKTEDDKYVEMEYYDNDLGLMQGKVKKSAWTVSFISTLIFVASIIVALMIQDYLEWIILAGMVVCIIGNIVGAILDD
jgi:hypothetical protein